MNESAGSSTHTDNDDEETTPKNFDVDTAAAESSLLHASRSSDAMKKHDNDITSDSAVVRVDDNEDGDDQSLPCFCGAFPEGLSDTKSIMSRLKKARSTMGSNEGGECNNDAIDMPSMLSSLYSCMSPDLEEEDEEKPVPASVLADPSRIICVVTTAALPWRTGTSVNPLLRALYLVRFQNERQKTHSGGGTGSVALVIPWLESAQEREKLYGSNNKFANGNQGMKEQEEWIRNYSKERCGMTEEAEKLKIVFYPAFYLAGFGSIFPKVDLCNFIPSDLVDVAILEEPEHLNWFRTPTKPEESDAEINHVGQKAEVSVSKSEDKDELEDLNTPTNTVNAAANDNAQNQIKDHILEKSKLGWTFRFRFVVGIVHTNYEEYARQYGIGASLIAAPAIGAVSALTIRAHCHKVIKLSDTLPSFAPGKECTCNVHGVRREFLEDGTVDFLKLTAKGSNETPNYGANEDEPASVYFIGKLVWAKGFDLMLEVQKIFRRNNGEYFSIDVYGGGPDEKAIVRAFHGRNYSTPTERPPPVAKGTISPPSSDVAALDPKDLNAALVFSHPNSIKAQTNEVIEQMRRSSIPRHDDDVVSQYLSLGFEVSGISGSVTAVNESRREDKPNADPISILGDLSGKSFDTGVKTSHAVYNIADSSIKNILAISFSKLKAPLTARRNKRDHEHDAKSDEGQEEREKSRFVFDPPKSRYELRRHPIPAKFPGVIDHAQLKTVPHKIFLNPSTSEVLCTTTAEALAMGKFVIIPKHPSNEFFLQFTNCLSYDTLLECAEKMQWALENTPTPLSTEEQRIFTWEAANERLMSSSIVTIKQAREWAENGMDKTDARIAFWLSESGEKGQMIRNLFQRKGESSSGADEED